MLLLFPTIKVPGLQDVEIFRDHKDESQFYAMRGVPKIAYDFEENPMLSFLFISRDAEIAYETSENKNLIEAQLGQLLLTVDLALTEEEQEIALDYLKEVLKDEQMPFVKLYRRLTRRRGAYRVPEPKIASPDTWKQGTAQLEILEGLPDTFKKNASAEVKPSLIGSNAAAFYATMGIEGAQMYYDALTKGYTGEGDEITPLQCIVRYSLTGYGMIPSLNIRVRGRSTEIYRYLQTKWNHYSYNYNKEKNKKSSGFWPFYNSSSKTTTVSSHMSRTQLQSLTKEMIDKKVILMEIEDYSDVALSSKEAQEVEDQIKQAIIDTILNMIIPRFFENALVALQEGIDEDDKKEEGTRGIFGGKGNSKYNYSSSSTYYFRDNIDVTKITDIDFQYRENRAVEFVRYPNGTLAVQLSEQERKDLIKYVDVSSPLIQILEVQVGVNADFQRDNIHSIEATLSYEAKDHESGVVREKTKTFVFKTGEEKYFFRATMARNNKGELINTYDVNAKIAYIGSSEAPPDIELKDVSSKSLTLSYGNLNYLSVDVRAGDVDWDIIDTVAIDFEYPEASNKPDARKEVRLTRDNPVGFWRSYMYGKESKEYRYSVKYYYNDGTEQEVDPVLDNREDLIVNDLLVGRAEASFDVILDSNSVDFVKVEVRYEDEERGVKEEYSHWFDRTNTWDWSIRLNEGATDNFKYRYFVQYTDGLVKTSEWTEAQSGDDVAPIVIKRYKRSLVIDGGLLWDMMPDLRVAYVSVRFSDTENNYYKEETIRLTSRDMFKNFEVLAFSPRATTFEYSVRLASRSGITSIPSTTIEGGVLLLEPLEEVF